LADALSLVRLNGTSLERPIALHDAGEVLEASCATVDFSIKVTKAFGLTSLKHFDTKAFGLTRAPPLPPDPL